MQRITDHNIKQSNSTEIGTVMLRKMIGLRFRLKKNTLISIVGNSGEGKSIAGLSVAYTIEPTFSIEEQIIYKPSELLTKIKHAKAKKYKVLMLDEAHTTTNAKDFMSLVNRAINLVATTFRELNNLCLIIVAPNIKLVDKGIREICNYYCICRRQLEDGVPVTSMEIFEIGFNYYDIKKPEPYLDKIYYKIYDKGNWTKHILSAFEIPKMPKEILAEYSAKSTEYKGRILEQQIEALANKMQEDEERAKLGYHDPEGLANKILNDPKLYKMLVKKNKVTGEYKLRKTEVKKIFELEEIDFMDVETRVLERIEAGV